jgi:IS30 family transposase
MKYHHLTKVLRYQIYALHKENLTITAIAKNIGVHKSTVSRELRRNKDINSYCPKKAQNFAEKRKKFKHKSKKLNEPQISYIMEKTELFWSPEQISGRMKLDKQKAVSHETIYKFIAKNKNEGGNLYKYLRHKNKKYKKKYGKPNNRGQIPNRKSIESRPNIVNQKKRIGDIEIDLIIGKNHKQALVTAVDIASKFTFIQKVKNKKATVVKKALTKMLLPVKSHIKTITSDNGKEFAKHEFVAKQLNIDYYFCHPYSSWERGLNENTNGLIRQFFPKGSDFITITKTKVKKVQENLNNRPRKILGYKTPTEVFYAKINKVKDSA